MIPLGAGFHASEAMGDRVVDRLIVAGLEMQEGVALQATPVATVERVVALEVERTAHGLAVRFCHDQNDLLSHGATQNVEEGAREIG